MHLASFPTLLDITLLLSCQFDHQTFRSTFHCDFKILLEQLFVKRKDCLFASSGSQRQGEHGSMTLISPRIVASLVLAGGALATQELNEETFRALTKSGRNGMIKFYQPVRA
jgi:hypothetical protein